MQTVNGSTRYANLSSRQALLVVGVTATVMATCLAVSFIGENPFDIPQQGGRDLQVYRNIVTRVHGGESYYDAAGDELRSNGYPTASVFNWRPPAYAWLIGNLPAPVWGQVLLCGLALVTLLLAYNAVQQDGKVWRAVAAVLLLLGVFQWCVDGDAFLSQELWAGVLIALSVCAYALGWWEIGLGAGLAALFLRELAIPYCVIAAAFAWKEGRRKEALLWAVGFSLYALFLAYHVVQVNKHLTAADRSPASWVQFGGLFFILKTCRMNVFLFSLPAWVSAIYLPLALLGLFGWRGVTALRVSLTVAAYLAAFAIVGQPFNDYWGLLCAALLPFGIVWAPAAITDLGRKIAQAAPRGAVVQPAAHP
jgi:hypothetical protein